LTGLSVDEVGERFKASATGNAFEIGKCSNADFITEFRNLFDLTGSNTELADLWNSWVQAPYEGIEAVIHTLKSNYQVACLSNTNDLHWQHLKTYMDLDGLFSPAYASHEINLAKPDLNCFQFVAKDLAVPAKDILFFDDSAANVEAAKAAGMTAHQVDAAFGVMPNLKSLGLIKPAETPNSRRPVRDAH